MIRVVADANVLVSAALALPHPAVCRDQRDDYLVAVAVATRAEAIVTGDRDVLELPDPPVALLTPRALIERLDAPT